MGKELTKFFLPKKDHQYAKSEEIKEGSLKNTKAWIETLTELKQELYKDLDSNGEELFPANLLDLAIGHPLDEIIKANKGNCLVLPIPPASSGVLRSPTKPRNFQKPPGHGASCERWGRPSDSSP